MQTFQDFLPLIQKAALLVPAVMILCYLTYHEVWVPLIKFEENFARYKEIPKKSRKDQIGFWVLGRVPDRRTNQTWRDRDAA